MKERQLVLPLFSEAVEASHPSLLTDVTIDHVSVELLQIADSIIPPGIQIYIPTNNGSRAGVKTLTQAEAEKIEGREVIIIKRKRGRRNNDSVLRLPAYRLISPIGVVHPTYQKEWTVSSGKVVGANADDVLPIGNVKKVIDEPLED